MERIVAYTKEDLGTKVKGGWMLNLGRSSWHRLMARAWLIGLRLARESAAGRRVSVLGLADGDGQDPERGPQNYSCTSRAGDMPPVDGFWSITMDFPDNGCLFVPNALNRSPSVTRDKPKVNADGSLTLYLQNASRARQGVELAAGAGGGLHPDVALVLAEGNSAVGPGRFLVAAGGAEN